MGPLGLHSLAFLTLCVGACEASETPSAGLKAAVVDPGSSSGKEKRAVENEPRPAAAAVEAEAEVPAGKVAEPSLEVASAGGDAAAPGFDPLTVRALKVRVVEVDPQGWAPCGILHSVGMIVVEVLEVEEPAPRMALILSCPADMHGVRPIQAGKVLEVTLHRRRQPWPKPTVAPPEGLPLRYVLGLAPGELRPLGAE